MLGDIIAALLFGVQVPELLRRPTTIGPIDVCVSNVVYVLFIVILKYVVCGAVYGVDYRCELVI